MVCVILIKGYNHKTGLHLQPSTLMVKLVGLQSQDRISYKLVVMYVQTYFHQVYLRPACSGHHHLGEKDFM